MRYPIRMKTIDSKSILSELDIHQLENIVWLRLSPVKDEIVSVRFEVTQLDDEHLSGGHMVHFEVRLQSGKAIRDSVTRFSKVAAWVASADRMKDSVESQLRFEASWLYRSARWTGGAFRSFIRTAARSFFAGGEKCSGSTT